MAEIGKYRIYTQDTKRLSKPTVAICARQTLGDDGIMRDSLFSSRHREGHIGFAIRAVENGTRHQLGWALLFKSPWTYGTWRLYIYIPSKYRRKGIGTALLNAANQLHFDQGHEKKIDVYPWRKESVRFYESLIDKDSDPDFSLCYT